MNSSNLDPNYVAEQEGLQTLPGIPHKDIQRYARWRMHQKLERLADAETATVVAARVPAPEKQPKAPVAHMSTSEAFLAGAAAVMFVEFVALVVWNLVR